MDVPALDTAIARDVAIGVRPIAVVATAGTTNTGAIDDLAAIRGVCDRHGVWMHVDAAYGGPAILADEYAEALKPIGSADSAALDPHKWMFVPVEAGFVIVGIFWVAHHNLFHLIKRSDRVFLWLNNLFLMCVAFVPFPTALMGEYVRIPIAVVPYGLTLIAAGLTLEILWRYATHRRRLVDPELEAEVVSLVGRRILVAPVVYALAVAASIVSVKITLAAYALVPIYYILPGRVDRHLASRAHPR